MSGDTQLARVARLARREEQRAATAVRHARAEQARSQATLDTFLGYRTEYARELTHAGTTVDAVRAGTLARFGDQLERSIAGLEQQLTELNGRCAAAMVAWQRAARRARATEDLARRHRDQRELRREETRQDELEDCFAAGSGSAA